MPVSANFLVALEHAANPALDPPSLEGLDQVDWGALSHAHGAATDFPLLLRAAVCDNPEDRQCAFQLLFETIWHQGTVWEATAATVPFLYRLLESDETPDRQSVAVLLATIADCDTGKDEHKTASRRAVAQRLDLLYPYLRDPDSEVRRSVAAAVGRYPELTARLLPDLETALRDESDLDVRKALQEIIQRRANG